MINDELILEAYDKLGYSPRDNQVPVIKDVLIEFIENNKRNVVLCLDTGAGKSIIAAVVSECIRKLTKPTLTSFILMHQNTLTDQYYDSFKHLDSTVFSLVKGAGQYPCKYLQRKLNSSIITADECQKEHMSPADISRNCNKCEFLESRKHINKTEQLITNYSYFFISQLWSQHLDDRAIHVFDESHLINEIFSEHCSIYVSEKRLYDQINELRDENRSIFIPEISTLENLRTQIVNKKVNESNYYQFLQVLHQSYKNIHTEFKNMVDESDDVNNKIKYDKKYKKYHNINCKIGDYFSYGYECVFDIEESKEFSVKPVFIKDMMDGFSSKYNLFMSATISEEYAIQTFGLNPDETSYITAPPVFHSENRPIFFLGEDVLNYNSMKDTEVLKKLIKISRKIVDIHSEDKGIILTPSFKLTEMFASTINSVRVFEHIRGQNVSKLIQEFKDCNEPAVLISPSLYEGLDLSDDNSRYQIIVKTPYASLGEKRIEYIANEYPDVYKMNTLYKILQGIGRSVRSIDDYANTYILDKNTMFLYNSKFNIWKKRYKTNL